MKKITCFKAYDIRGQLGTQLDEDVAYRIGAAYAQFLQPKTVVVGGDVRETSESLKNAVTNGMLDMGVDVIDIGMVGTEEVYFATAHLSVDGGIEVTASHNPIDYNGMKLVKEDAKPISGDTGLNDIQRLAEQNDFIKADSKGTLTTQSILEPYIAHLMTYIEPSVIKPMKIVVNSGNGAAGHALDGLEQAFNDARVPVEFIKVHHEPDPTFPNGIPNPILIENRKVTADAVIEHKADLGIAWDGDFDRCFFFDENARFIEGYYVVGLLAEAFMQKKTTDGKPVKVIHDPRLTWNTIDIASSNNGEAIQSKTGHAFIKERMRKEDAAYGGEMSAHHYFRDFSYCDSGMIPWLLVIELMSRKQKKLSELVDARIEMYPSPGEINRRVDDAKAVIAAVRSHFEPDAMSVDETDGISMEFAQWRFNLRSSNTEPVIRLNLETRQDQKLMEEKTQLLLGMIGGTA
jgi:phosphomannomutase